jgi:4-diphosphocytidyl-2-C-methyl-D-erythritol kinase
MTIAVRSFAKINLGLYIGARRADGFHELRTVYQTIALHDVIRVSVEPTGGRARNANDSRAIEILCDDPRVPLDSSNTCHRAAALVMEALGLRGRVTIGIEKRLPVQGGLGAASSNAVATMLALERALKKKVADATRLRIAAQVGSDLPLFLIGGTALGVGRGEQVYPLPDLPSIPMVIVTPGIGVSTPKAFADWDEMVVGEKAGGVRVAWTGEGARPQIGEGELTHSGGSDRMTEVGRALSAWLCCNPETGAPAKGGGRAGSLLSDLVRAGIENDFEKVVFPEFPELRDMKRALVRAGARYASLSGSGATLYGLFESEKAAVKAAHELRKRGLKATATRTLTRREYWKWWLLRGR